MGAAVDIISPINIVLSFPSMLEEKVYATKLNGPLELGWQTKLARFVANLPVAHDSHGAADDNHWCHALEALDTGGAPGGTAPG